MRGVASNADSARLVGIPTGRILAGLVGDRRWLGQRWPRVLVAGNQGQVTPTLMVTVFTYATAAAVLGGLDSPGGAVIGGLLIGIGENLAAEFAADVDRPGHEAGRRPAGHLRGAAVQAVGPVRHGESGASVIKIKRGSIGHWAIRLVWVAAVVALVLYIPTKTEAGTIGDFTLAFEYAIAAMSLNLVLGYAGIISIGHSAFFGLGMYTTAILVTRYDWSQGWTFFVAARSPSSSAASSPCRRCA